MKKRSSLIGTGMLVGLLFCATPPILADVQETVKQVEVVSFTCLQFQDEDGVGATNQIAMVDRSSERWPMPETGESCNHYFGKLMSQVAFKQGAVTDSVQYAMTECEAQIILNTFRPPSSREFPYACFTFVIWDIW